MISSITLSTGRTVKLPTFAAIEHQNTNIAGNNVIQTRQHAFLRVIDGNVSGGTVTYEQCTNAEMVEFFNIIYNGDCTAFNTVNSDIYTVGAAKAIYGFWCYSGQLDKYVFVCNLSDRVNNNVHEVFSYYEEYGRKPYYYRSADYQTPSNSFYTDAENLLSAPEYNLRPSSSLDILTNGYFLNAAGFSGGMDEATMLANIEAYMTAHPDEDIDYDTTNVDYENPYGVVVSEAGGGDGTMDEGEIEEIENVPIPDLPTIDINSCGFITTYTCTTGQLAALASFLWSNAFDIDSFKKLFSDPMQAIIGLGIVPVQPVSTGAQVVKFGDISTGVSMNTCKQYAQKSCGSVTIRKYIGSFLDYDPYVKISLYLPYIGIRELSADDVMDDTVTVTYNVDVLTGGCAAIVSTTKKGVLYQFNGSCITNVPLTSINYSQAIQNAVGALGSVATVAVGAATGAAPIAAMGVAGLAANAANTAVNSKPTIQRSGSMGGSAGMLSVQKPYLIINRPKLSVPDKLNKFTGNTCNITMNLGKAKGFTMVDYVILKNIPAMEDEKKELETILKKGVIFKWN